MPPDPPPPITPLDPPNPIASPDMLRRSPIILAPTAPSASVAPPDQARAWPNRSDLDRTNISTIVPQCRQRCHVQPARFAADDNLPRYLHQATAQSMGPGVVTHLAWNCRGSGGSLHNSTMNHLARLLVSTRAQVCFLSETRNASITKTAIKIDLITMRLLLSLPKANQVVFGSYGMLKLN